MNTKPISPIKRTAIMVGIILTLILLFFSGLFISKSFSLTNRLLIHEAVLWSVAVFTVLYATVAERSPLFGTEKRYDANFYLSWILGLFVACMGANLLTNFICAILRVPYDQKGQQELTSVLTSNNWIMILSATTAGVTEEIIFRGYLLEKFQQLFNDERLAIGLSAALFAFAHSGYRSPRTIVYTFVIGCLFGLHYRRYQSLIVLILGHAFFDLVLLLYYKNTF